MKLFLVILFIISSGPSRARPEAVDEASLMKTCSSPDLEACQKLAAFYLSRSEWDKAILVSEALCGKDVTQGCTFAGSAHMAKGQVKEANRFLSLACDKFEPLSCRSLGRLMDRSGEAALANMYFKRSCFYGLKDLCSQVKDSKSWYSPEALNVLNGISRDCGDPKDEACKSHLNLIQRCGPPLKKQDCQLLAGHLSIYFRAKFMQAEAKLVLLTLFAAEKAVKEEPKSSGYTYNLGRVLKAHKPLEKYQYVFGFMKECGKKYVLDKKNKTNSLELYPTSYLQQSSRISANIREYFNKGKRDECYDSKTGYKAYAVGNLDPHNPTHLDVWMIDHDQHLENIKDGLPLP